MFSGGYRSGTLVENGLYIKIRYNFKLNLLFRVLDLRIDSLTLARLGCAAHKQKQSPADVLQTGCSEKLPKTHREKSASQSFFLDKVVGCRLATLSRKDFSAGDLP